MRSRIMRKTLDRWWIRTFDLSRTFELTDEFFSSPALRKFAVADRVRCCRRAGQNRRNVDGASSSLHRIEGDGKNGACAACHSGPMLNQTNEFLPVPVPPGTRFISVNVSEFNVAHNPVRNFIFKDPNGVETIVPSPDPGRALITGMVGGPPPGLFTNLNAFKIPTSVGREKEGSVLP